MCIIQFTKIILDYLNQVLLLEVFEALWISVFDKTVFCLGEKQVMVVNMVVVLGINSQFFTPYKEEGRKEILHSKVSACKVPENNPTCTL